MATPLCKKQRTKRPLLFWFVFVILLWIYPLPARAQEDEITAGGKFQYQSHCAVCHGANGTGDGRMAQELLSTPADLTQLAKKNDGRFPFWEVYRIIDGRDEVKAHGPRAMPIWGNWFYHTEGSELLATARVLELVYYLKSIQAK
jgi:mono/diheme cytochrome c family protein